MSDTRPTSSINFLSLFLAALGLLWLFSVVRACTQQADENFADTPTAAEATMANTQPAEEEQPSVPPPAIPEYIPLEITPCALTAQDSILIPQLLMQFFRSDVLTANGGMTWSPNPKIDKALYKIHRDSWESRVICLQDIRQVGKAMERLAIISSNYEGNQCADCTHYIGWIRFTIEENDPITLVVRSSDRNAYQYEPGGPQSENIGLAEVGPYEWAVVLTGKAEKGGPTLMETELLDLKDFHSLLTVPNIVVEADSSSQSTPLAFDYFFFKPVEEDYYPLLHTSQVYWPRKDSLAGTNPVVFNYDAKKKRYTVVE